MAAPLHHNFINNTCKSKLTNREREREREREFCRLAPASVSSKAGFIFIFGLSRSSKKALGPFVFFS